MASNKFNDPYHDAYSVPQRYDSPGHQRQDSNPFNDSNEAGAYPQHDSMYPPHQPYSQPYHHLSRDSFDDYGIPKEAIVGSGAGAGTRAGIGAGGDGGGFDRDPRSNPYSAQYQSKKGNGKKKWLIVGAVLLVVIGVIAGIVAWRVSASKDSGGAASSGGLQYIEGTAKVVKSDPSDPSQFEKDPALKKSFWGMTYTPFLAQEPWCGVTLANVTEDIQWLSQTTSRLRMYGAGCNMSQITLQAIQDTKVDMKVWLGAYIGDNSTVNEQQKQWTLDAIQAYGTDRIEGVVVGNEYLLNAADKATAISFILGHVADFKTRLAALNLPKTIPVGTGDAGKEIDPTLVVGIDFFMANVHPFFSGSTVEVSAGWTWEYTEVNDVAVANAAPNKPEVFIAETGWPSGSMTAAEGTYQGSVAGLSQLQIFLDTYVCEANRNGSSYFWFSPFDEPWKRQFGGVEPYWGLADENKRLKAITLPDCPLA